MTILILAMVLILNFFLQSAIFPYLSIWGVVPNTALLIVMSVSLLKGKYYGGFMGLIMGLLQDIIFSPVIGINAFIYFFAGYCIGLIENKLNRDNVFIPLLFSFVVTLYYNFAYYVFMFFLAREIPLLSFIKDIMIVEMIYNGILSIPIYRMLSRIFVAPTIRFGRR